MLYPTSHLLLWGIGMHIQHNTRATTDHPIDPVSIVIDNNGVVPSVQRRFLFLLKGLIHHP
jgi:hypothetical protein